jgi:hypothetical protein
MKPGLIAAFFITLVAGATSAQQGASTASPANPPTPAPANTLQLAGPVNEQGSFGLGLLLGEPTGLGMKYWLSGRTAVDAGAGWSFKDRDGFQLHGDFLYHILDLVHVDKGQLPLYIGVGGRVKFVEHGDNRAGLRLPVGVAYLFADAPVEVFAEVAPIIDFAPNTSLQWNGGIGFRYYFR